MNEEEPSIWIVPGPHQVARGWTSLLKRPKNVVETTDFLLDEYGEAAYFQNTPWLFPLAHKGKAVLLSLAQDDLDEMDLNELVFRKIPTSTTSLDYIFTLLIYKFMYSDHSIFFIHPITGKESGFINNVIVMQASIEAQHLFPLRPWRHGYKESPIIPEGDIPPWDRCMMSQSVNLEVLSNLYANKKCQVFDYDLYKKQKEEAKNGT